MFRLQFLIFLLPSVFAISTCAQLSGPVGPTTSRESKRGTVCNVLNYKGLASKTADIGPAIQAAHAACKNGGLLGLLSDVVSYQRIY